MADHECVRCSECDSCPACAADALDDTCIENRRLREQALALRLALETVTRERDEAERERDEALRTVKALTPAANYCLEYKPLLLKAEHERDKAIRVLRDIATFGWYAKGAKVARAYLAAREGR